MKKRQEGQIFSVLGGMRIALRRCLSSVSSYSMGLALELDVHRTTVTQWESHSRSAMLASFKRWHICCRKQIIDKHDPDACDRRCGCRGLTLAANFVRGDATHAQVLQKCKLHSTELVCAYVTDPITEDEHWQEVLEHLDCRELLGDLQVCGGGTIEHTH